MANGMCALISGTGLVLARGDQSWQVTTLSFDRWKDSATHWLPIEQPDRGNYVFQAEDGGVLYSDYNGAVTIWLENYEALMPNVVWNLAKTQMHPYANPPWYDYVVNPINTAVLAKLGIGNFYNAVRPSFDVDHRNLNILGNGPYAPGNAVAAWSGWGGGQGNEVWQIADIDDIQNGTYKVSLG